MAPNCAMVCIGQPGNNALKGILGASLVYSADIVAAGQVGWTVTSIGNEPEREQRRGGKTE